MTAWINYLLFFVFVMVNKCNINMHIWLNFAYLIFFKIAHDFLNKKCLFLQIL